MGEMRHNALFATWTDYEPASCWQKHVKGHNYPFPPKKVRLFTVPALIFRDIFQLNLNS